ncbi:FAD-dependent oxidoreductase [Pseudomonas fluorescens]|uniref:NADH oxidase n=1 Tax=Pseudomonas fluorescens TaxID=294 RepID=A0A5E7BZS3_PSEFL|nr:FAD-dependent oxidoreductase [Pseudomonas fluorescens]VVN97549.1 NADH oxidase [Pseudomonas fluorescens]
MTQLPQLFSPMKIGPMQVKNRIMMPGMSAGQMLDADLNVTPEMIAYFVERAKAEPGLMAVGASEVVPPPAVDKPRFPLSLYDDKWIPSLKQLVDAVHEYDTKFGIQLWTGGTQSSGSVHLSPSGIPSMAAAVVDARYVPKLKVLTVDDIKQVVQHFADAARRCKQAGFDFVEIHAGHGYLISAFLTPYFNRRTDEYGGSLENRSRFLVEILRAVREAVGADTGVGVKINGEDFLAGEGGWTVQDAVALAPLLEREGADYISVTAGVMGGTRLTIPPMYEKQGCFTDLAEAVKQVVSIPVATIGRIKNPVMANDLVARGVADIVCMGRAMIVDSEVVSKARRGDIADVRQCLADCRGCADHEMRSIRRGSPGQVSCVLNPRMQRESVCIDIEGASRDNPKKILVIGAGLAGLEAARRTAFSGHQVVLCESRSWLGGQIRYAAMIPGRHEIADMLPWYELQLQKHGVEVRLNTKVDVSLIKALNPDVVFVATGSVAQVPQNMLEGLSNARNIEFVMIDDLLEEKIEVGDNVLVVGGDQIGMQAADYLSEGGRSVVVAEAHNHFAQKLAANDRWYLVGRAIEKKVGRVKNVSHIEIDSEDQVWLNNDQGRQHVPGVNTVVFASERRSDRALAEVARSLGIETHVVGDAFDVTSEDAGTIFANVAQAYDIARRI